MLTGYLKSVIVIFIVIYLFIKFQLISGKVVAVGPGARDVNGKFIPVSVKEGDTVLLPEYGGAEVKLGDKKYVLVPLVESYTYILIDSIDLRTGLHLSVECVYNFPK